MGVWICTLEVWPDGGDESHPLATQQQLVVDDNVLVAMLMGGIAKRTTIITASNSTGRITAVPQ